jgi:hydrogenase nickel incorporation protein HypB
MCAICGCSDAQHSHEHDAHQHEHEHGHGHGHTHTHTHTETGEARRVRLEAEILGKNRDRAGDNRRYFEQQQILALNLVSSPGSGKTTLLERTIRDLGARVPFCVIEGDQATERDAERIRRAGARAVQLNTGTVCHLDAAMVEGALRELAPAAGSVLAIENIGNLVCPALFDLGEQARIVVASFAEGDDKPLKYPYMFRSADLVILNKSDLCPYVEFDVEKFCGYVRSLNPRAHVLPLSATRGDGLSAWYDWLAGARR